MIGSLPFSTSPPQVQNFSEQKNRDIFHPKDHKENQVAIEIFQNVSHSNQNNHHRPRQLVEIDVSPCFRYFTYTTMCLGSIIALGLIVFLFKMALNPSEFLPYGIISLNETIDPLP